MHSHSISRYDIFCFYLSIIDIFFLPYLPFVSVSISVFFIAIWIVKNVRVFCSNTKGTLFLIMVFFMLISTLYSKFYSGETKFDTSLATSIKRFFQYSICLSYYFFFISFFRKRKFNVCLLLHIFIFYVFLLSIIWKAFPSNYAQIKYKINPVDNHTIRFLYGLVEYRFNYLWTDPNNLAYLIGGITAFLILKDNSLWRKFLSMCLSFVIIVFTASIGGLLVFILVLFCLFLLNLRKRIFNRKLIILISSFLIVLFVLILISNYDFGIFQNLKKRWLVYDSNRDFSGGRLEDIKTTLKYFNPIFLILGSGHEGFSSENGHLYLICMYGFIAYCLFFYLFFFKHGKQQWKDYIWIFSFFVAFSVNIAIGEFKWLSIYLFLLAYTREEYIS